MLKLNEAEPEKLKNVLITGASSGLGLATARQLMKSRDLRLILTARESSLCRFSEAGFQESDRLVLRPLRVNTDAERREVIREIDERWGGVDVLINNAGVAYRAVMEHLQSSEIDRQMEINFSAPLQLIRLVLPSMRKKRGGRIINVSSVGGIMAMPTMTPYSASKWALEGVSEALWYEMRPWNIKVSVVQPGFIRSSSFENTRMTEASQKSAEDIDDPYHTHYFYMERLIRLFMNNAPSTPETVAKKIEKVMRSRRPALRVPATPDAHLFAILRKTVPRPIFHRFLYYTLPNIAQWGEEKGKKATAKIKP